jgi:hypothetical protein
MSYPGYTTITFGKFKGRTFEDVYRNERSYCAWVLGVQTAHSDTVKFQRYVQYHGLRTADMNKRVTCTYCKGIFPGQLQLEAHIDSEHEVEKRNDEKWAVQMTWSNSNLRK